MYLDTMLCLVMPAVFVVRAGWAVAADLVRAVRR